MNNANPFHVLEAAAEHGLGVSLSPEQVKAILARRNQLIEDKNSVVRENWNLSAQTNSGQKP